MCDYVSGELVLCFPRADLAAMNLVNDIREGLIEHVEHVEDLEQKLRKMELKPDEDLNFEFHRVRVPEGEEHWKVTFLHFFYKHKLLEILGSGKVDSAFLDCLKRSDYQFTAAPNHVLSLAGPPLGKSAVKVSKFNFSQFHSSYKGTLGLPSQPSSNLNQVEITILDSGIADDATFVTGTTKNFVDPSAPNNIDDENGHGTVVALIISELAPNARISVLKVADRDGRASEFDTMAALATCGRTDIVNLSLQFGLQDRVCKVCGRESQSSRSAVFENIVRQFENKTHRSILVAAAGNYSLDQLSFPARFSTLLAIGSINSQGNLSYESNWGAQYNDPGTPDSHFVCPGGDDTCSPEEVVGSFGAHDGSIWHGTSFAAAYASGVLANVVAQRLGSYDYDVILHDLRKGADPSALANYDPKKHGHGLLRYT